MKITKFIAIITASLLLWGCNTESNPSSVKATQEMGAAQITINAQQVGSLAKVRADIGLTSLVLTLSAEGETSRVETITISGNGSQTILHPFSDLTPLKTWTVEAVSYDQNSVVIHQGGSTFEVYPGKTSLVTLDLDAKYSMLKATFSPITDSITSLHVLVDGVEVATSSFAAASQAEAVLEYDYLLANAPTTTNIVLHAKGSYWDVDYTLYKGSVDIVVNPGEDTNYEVNLVWVGPGEPPVGAAEITVNLGAVGTVSLDGQIEADPFAPAEFDVSAFTGAFAPSEWVQTGKYIPSFSESTMAYNHRAGGVLSTLTIPADGVITFDWAHKVISEGDYVGANSLQYIINGVGIVLSTTTTTGSTTGVVVKAGDSFGFGTWASSKRASISGSVSNFTFTED